MQLSALQYSIYKISILCKLLYGQKRISNDADLFRVKEIDSEGSQLLEKAGVDTVKELKNRKAENLHAKIAEINKTHNLVRQLPGLSTVESWIDVAKALEPMVTY